MKRTYSDIVLTAIGSLSILYAQSSVAASPWEQHRGNCDAEVLSDPERPPIAELTRCVRLLAAYRLDLSETQGSERQRIVTALRRVIVEDAQSPTAETARYFLTRWDDETPLESPSPTPAGSVEKESWRVLASDTKGFLVIDAYGSRTRLFESEAPIDSVAYDGAKELAWFVSDKRLWVLDLRAEGHRPVVIAARLPVAEFEISGWSNVSAGLEDYNEGAGYNLGLRRYPIITLQPEPKVEVGQAGDADRPEDAVPSAAIKRIALVGSDWLKAQRLRPSTPAPAKLPDPRHVALPEGDAYGCEELSLCGSASPLGRTGLELVVVIHACGDRCHTSCLLHDRKSKRFASPADGVWAARPEPFSCEVAVAPDDAQYFVGRSHCQVRDRVVSCRDATDVNLLGWVASKHTLAPASP